MRIIGGKYGGRVFRANKSFKSRPTTEIAKEALFNILENRYNFPGKTVLDLFSGTGSIGYEFISRGCLRATLVELDANHQRFIRSVVNQLKIDNVEVVKADVFQFLKKSTETFDFIFADPPFDLKNFSEVPEAVLKSKLLADDGLFIMEHPGSFNFSHHPYFREIRRYGQVHFSFFEKNPTD